VGKAFVHQAGFDVLPARREVGGESGQARERDLSSWKKWAMKRTGGSHILKERVVNWEFYSGLKIKKYFLYTPRGRGRVSRQLRNTGGEHQIHGRG